MSKSIKLSKEHGVNPTIPICFWCDKDKNEVVMLGKLPGDVEAPKRMWIPGDYEPCEECKKMWDEGIVLFEAYKEPIYDENQPPFHGAYPNGRFMVMSEEGVKKIFMPEMAKTLLEKRMGFMNHETINALKRDIQQNDERRRERMKKYIVEFEIFFSDGKKGYKTVTIEAGNKKIAALRAMSEINKDESVAQLYKNLMRIKEVA